MRLPLLLPLLLVAPARAQEPPACNAGREGLEVCIAGKLCRCHYEAGGSLTARPGGVRWDCGILRPDCGGVAPAGSPPAPLPPGLMLNMSPMQPPPQSVPGTPR